MEGEGIKMAGAERCNFEGRIIYPYTGYNFESRSPWGMRNAGRYSREFFCHLFALISCCFATCVISITIR